MKIKNIIIGLIMSVNLFGEARVTSGDIGLNEGSIMLAPLTENLINSTAWTLIMSELEISLEIGNCGIFPGLRAHMIEPIGYAERVDRPLDFPFIGISIDSNPVKANTPRESGGEGGDTPKVQATNSHFIYIPILGMILKKTAKFWCLHNGPIALPYLSEFDMTYKQDFLYLKMVPQMLAMFSPEMIIAGLIDCVATETAAALYGYQGENLTSDHFETTTGEVTSDDDFTQGLENGDERSGTIGQMTTNSLEFVNNVRNSLYFIDGCNGFSPIGGYQDGNDPIIEAHNDWHGISGLIRGISAISPLSVLKKTSTFNFFAPNGARDSLPKAIISMCAPKPFPLPIASETLLQQAYPTVGGAHEMGQTGIAVSTAKAVPSMAGTVMVVWSRRDYYAFAYSCPGAKAR